MYYRRIIVLSIALLIPSLKSFAENDPVTLSVWVNEAIVATYTYDYQNLLKRQKEIAKYYTAQGWVGYSKAFLDSKLPDIVRKNAYYVSAVATLPPKITQIRDGYWQATMPLLVVYENPQYQQKQTLNVAIGFVTAPPGQGVRGYAITEIITQAVDHPCRCPVKPKKSKPQGATPSVQQHTPK